MSREILVQFNTSAGMAFTVEPGETLGWDDALLGAIQLLRHAVERSFSATGRTTLASQRMSAAADALDGVSMAQWYADLATPADKEAVAVLDWRESQNQDLPCCSKLENARAWAQGG